MSLHIHHRNKKITECVKGKEFAQTLRKILYESKADALLKCIEEQINSTQDEGEIEGLWTLLNYQLRIIVLDTGELNRIEL